MDIKYACSIGTFCQAAMILKRNGLKMASYPFDWIFSSAEMAKDCITDNFASFLDKSYYTNIRCRWNDHQCGHKKYHTNMFNHRDPRTEQDYHYYVRCVERFRDVLRNDARKLFILFYPNIEDDDHNDSEFKKSIIELNTALKEKTHNYTLLCLTNRGGMSVNHHTFTTVDNIDFLEVHTKSKSTGERFADELDNIYADGILKGRYKFDLVKIY